MIATSPPIRPAPSGGAARSLALAIWLGVVAGCDIAAAHDGPDPLAAWYRSLRSPDGRPCCSLRDCAPAEARLRDGGWEVLVQPYEGEARWLPVPARAVLRRENPDGRPILCRTPNGFIRCFVPPAGA